MSVETRSWLTLLVTTLILIPCAGSLGDERASRGRTLLAQHCGSCHAIDRTSSSPLPTAPAFRAIGNRLDFDDLLARLEEGLSSAHRQMPTFRFDREDARAIRAYLTSIQE